MLTDYKSHPITYLLAAQEKGPDDGSSERSSSGSFGLRIKSHVNLNQVFDQSTQLWLKCQYKANTLEASVA